MEIPSGTKLFPLTAPTVKSRLPPQLNPPPQPNPPPHLNPNPASPRCGGMTRKKAEVLLAAVIIARSTSYLLSKVSMQSMGPFTLLSIRFLVAFLFLTLLFGKKLRSISVTTLLRGMILGAVFFSVMTAELFGLRSTDSSTTSFLENTAIVFVPLIEALLHRKFPRTPTLLSAAVTMFGIGLLTLRGGTFTLKTGELLCLLAAILYALAIIVTDRISRRDDPLTLGILQVGFIGLFALAASFLFETPRLPANGTQWLAILALALICSGFGFTLQPVAQRYTTSERAGMFCALNPVTAAVLGRLFLGEHLGLQGMIGAGFVLSGILLSTLFAKNAENRDNRLT